MYCSVNISKGGKVQFVNFSANVDCFPVNAISWASPDYGLMLACGSSDGSISIITSSG